jgi:flagellar capping protein FliD
MVTRINGFSGMDIDTMVKSMMATKQARLDKITQDKQIVEWQRESYRELSSKLYDFRMNKLTSKYITDSSALNTNKAVLSGNTTAVKAEAQGNATGIEMKVSVIQLAKSTTKTTSGLGQGVRSSTTLAALEGIDLNKMSPSEMENYFKKGFDIKINGVSFVDKDGKSLFNGMTSISTLVATINSKSEANAIASYDEITGKLSIASRTSGEAGKIDIETPTGGNSIMALFSKKTVIETNGVDPAVGADPTLAELRKQLDDKEVDPDPDAPAKDYSFVLNGKTFTFSETDKVSDVLSKINADTDAVAKFENGKLTITANSGKELKMSGRSYEFLNLFKGIKQYEGGIDSLTTTNGQDARVKINDEEELTGITSNTFTINGVQMNLLSETVTKDASGNVLSDNPVIIKNQIEPDKAIETIKSFIEDYNTLIKALNTSISETKYRDFKPLTDEQKKLMNETEINAWTQKSKSGLLKNNDIIKSVLSEMRAVITDKLGPLSNLGITTGNYAENGKLIISDEFKLKEALNKTPKLAIDLFQGPENARSEGIFSKLNQHAMNAIQKISDRAGTNRFTTDVTSTFSAENPMGRQLKDYNNRILLMQRNIKTTEDRYYRQFAAMEKAMTKMQSQTNSLISKMGN